MLNDVRIRVSVSLPKLWRGYIISNLEKLKAAATIKDFAEIVGYKPKALSFIIYGIKEEAKYSTFEIPKSHGGKRVIKAPVPKLKTLQKRLSLLLQNCIEEINQQKEITATLSHGFRRKYSIVTNAQTHINRRYVFNADLSDFFGSINFGRVRGFFIKNNNFKLNPQIATIIAQIACHDHTLPQGSPCSPVLSNLIGHVLDIRLAALAKRYGCTYSRYADDLTFSTNKTIFPSKIARENVEQEQQWIVGRSLERILERSGFSVNPSKTRMQFRQSRQDVTGLIVNKRVNTKWEYRHQIRVMVNHLRKTGSFYLKQSVTDDEGGTSVENVVGSLEQLNGMLSFVQSVNSYQLDKEIKNGIDEVKRRNKGKKFKNPAPPRLSGFEEVYKDFLFYKDFYANPIPVIICEGKTDNIYLRAAIESLADKFPSLVEKQKDGRMNLKVRIYNYTDISKRILKLAGGTGDLCKFIKEYDYQYKRIESKGTRVPVILLVDNDYGAFGKGGIYVAIKDVLNLDKKPEGNKPNYSIVQNLSVVPTPKIANKPHSMIEDFFEPKLLKTKLNGKKFSKSNQYDATKEYGKYLFATQIVKKQQSTIDFSGFEELLTRLSNIVVGGKT